jgi:hypothetical protein
MNKRSSFHRVLAISVGIALGTRELIALQRVYFLRRMTRLKPHLV